MGTARGQGTGHRPVPQGRLLPAIQIIIVIKRNAIQSWLTQTVVCEGVNFQ